LDTISDFCKYLTDIESLCKQKGAPTIRDERDRYPWRLYLQSKSFDHLLEFDEVFLDYGLWEEVISRSEYKSRIEEDRISYFWDHLVNVLIHVPEMNIGKQPVS